MDRIEGAGLVLRPWEAGDVEDLCVACRDEEIQRWTTIPSPYGRADAEHFVLDVAPTQWRDGTGAHFAVLDAETGSLLGSAGLVAIEPAARRAEVGYWVAAGARRQGVAGRALSLLCRWAITTKEIERLALMADVGNVASRRVAERAGFHYEGLLRSYVLKGGRRRDQVLYSLLPEEA